uniref:Uncharacterized protein n=1 Tax=Oryza sativa subsp. japonica TaxID=39947 RepID=Q2QSI3_ORYSJ|nr:hypothetical protein LOC_Os12g24010 [Oryza sativa Japonica Group]
MDSPTTSYSTTSAVERSILHLPTRSEPSSSSTTWSIEIIQASSFAAYQKMSDRMMSNEYATRKNLFDIIEDRMSLWFYTKID